MPWFEPSCVPSTWGFNCCGSSWTCSASLLGSILYVHACHPRGVLPAPGLAGCPSEPWGIVVVRVSWPEHPTWIKKKKKKLPKYQLRRQHISKIVKIKNLILTILKIVKIFDSGDGGWWAMWGWFAHWLLFFGGERAGGFWWWQCMSGSLGGYGDIGCWWVVAGLWVLSWFLGVGLMMWWLDGSGWWV